MDAEIIDSAIREVYASDGLLIKLSSPYAFDGGLEDVIEDGEGVTVKYYIKIIRKINHSFILFVCFGSPQH